MEAPQVEAPQARTLGELLRSLRVARHMSLVRLAELAREGNAYSGISRVSLAWWEGGRRVPLAPQLRVILLVLGASEGDTIEAIIAASKVEWQGGGSYRALVAAWGAGGLEPEQQIRSWHSWALCTPTRPARSFA